MMICPETFYEMNLKGKNAAEIMTVIRSLKQEIGKLKNLVENPYYTCEVKPSESTRISCLRDYLERAKQTLEEAGGVYTPSIAEQKAMAFDANIPYINKVVFCIGGYWDGYETKTYTIDGDRIRSHIEHSLILEPSNIGDAETKEIDKEWFLKELQGLHLGEWRRRYDSDILDGTQWNLEIYFSNGHKTIKFYGSNAYPYNFDRVLDLFK